MEEELSKLWENFNLKKEKTFRVTVKDDSLKDYASKGKACLVGKLIAERVLEKKHSLLNYYPMVETRDFCPSKL